MTDSPDLFDELATPAPPSRSRRAVRIAALLAIGVFGPLVLLEIGLRVFDPFHFAEILERERFAEAILTRGDDGRLRLRPGARATYLGHEAVINGRGLRNPAFSRHKPRGVYRILVVGDSVAFGWGVAERDCFPRVLERELGKRTPPEGIERFEVINASVPGWGLGDEYLYLQEQGLAYEPDLVIVTFINNDIPIVEVLAEDEIPKPPSKLASWLSWSYLARAIDHSLLVLGNDVPAGDYFADLEKVPESVALACRGFGLLKEVCGDVRLAVVDTVGVRGRGGLAEIIECLRKLRIPRIQAYIAGPGYREKYAVSETDLHPNAAGHAELARRVLRWLEQDVLK